MASVSLIDCIEAGTRFAYVYHVAGMDWAATDDPEFAAWINSSSGASYRIKLYGSSLCVNNTPEAWASAGDVQTLCILQRNLGTQTVTASRDGLLDVGAWQVSINGSSSGYQFGKLFDYDPIETFHDGITGLTWQPDVTVPGIAYGVMSRDFRPDPTDSFLGKLYWRTSQDFGLKALLDASGNVYLWFASSCVRTYSAVTTSGNDYVVDVAACQFNTPPESVFYDPALRHQITAVQMNIAGNTARLMAVPITVTESLT